MLSLMLFWLRRRQTLIKNCWTCLRIQKLSASIPSSCYRSRSKPIGCPMRFVLACAPAYPVKSHRNNFALLSKLLPPDCSSFIPRDWIRLFLPLPHPPLLPTNCLVPSQSPSANCFICSP